jgi:hypothetical protein
MSVLDGKLTVRIKILVGARENRSKGNFPQNTSLAPIYRPTKSKVFFLPIF